MTIYRVVVSIGPFDGLYDFAVPEQAMKFAEAITLNGRPNYKSMYIRYKPKAIIQIMTKEQIEEEEAKYEAQFAELEKEMEDANDK